MKPTRDAWIALARAAKAEVRELELALDRAALVAEQDQADDASVEFEAITKTCRLAWRLINAMHEIGPLPTVIGTRSTSTGKD